MMFRTVSMQRTFVLVSHGQSSPGMGSAAEYTGIIIESYRNSGDGLNRFDGAEENDAVSPLLFRKCAHL